MDKSELLVSVAFDLFYRHGVHAVGINRLLEESGIAKKTLYNHFASKEDLVAATVDYRHRQFYAWMDARTRGAADGESAIYALFDALDDWFNDRDKEMGSFHGSYFTNVSAEYGELDHPIHQRCAEHKKAILRLIVKHVGKIFSDQKTVDLIAEAILLLKDGAVVQAHVRGDLKAAVKAKEVVAELLKARLTR